MEIVNDYDFDELVNACWSGAEGILKDIQDTGFENEFMDYLEDMFCDEVPTMTQINDFIRFECNGWLEDKLGKKQPEDIDDILTYFDSKSVINYNLISMEDDEKVLEVAEQFSTIEEFYNAFVPYNTFDEFYEDYRYVNSGQKLKRVLDIIYKMC